MISCPTCGHPNPESAAFCSQCGTRLAVRAGARPATVLLGAELSAPAAHRLTVVRPGGTDGAIFPLLPGRTVLGRGEVQVRLDDPYLSPRHAELQVREDGVLLVDLQSSNGLFLRLRGETPLAPGDELRLGRQLLRFEVLPEPQAAPDSGRIWGSPNRGARFRVAQLLEGSGLGEALPIGDGDYLFGREEGGMTFPADPSVSRRHAILSVAQGRAVVRDLESANGTFLRLRRETLLRPGDQLLAGQQQLRYDRT